MMRSRNQQFPAQPCLRCCVEQIKLWCAPRDEPLRETIPKTRLRRELLSRNGACQVKGFTLLEVLVALFISTILFAILEAGLHHVVSVQSRVEAKSVQLHELQTALLVLSRSLSEILNRTQLDENGQKEPAFVGSFKEFSFTRAGLANFTGSNPHPLLQREHYLVSEGVFWHSVLPILADGEVSRLRPRQLLSHVTDAHFEYLGASNRFHSSWPSEDEPHQPLPKAIRIFLTLAGWGEVSQLYVIPNTTHETK